jgi:serine phosphatase RsbU (regulator of sigma subunit)
VGVGKHFYAHLEPIRDARGAVIGAYEARYPLETMDEIVRELSGSPVFEHGFLAVVDSHGKVLFQSSPIEPARLSRYADGLSQGAIKAGDVVDGYRLFSPPAGGFGPRVVAGVYEPDLVAQAVRLEGGSLGMVGVVIVMSLSLAWLMARRLTEALADAQRSRADAEQARAAAEAAGAALTAELEQAAHYVESLLPSRVRLGAVAADWLYRPSVGVGGDAFGYHWLDETHFAFYLLDVCGHGVGAALLATTVMNLLRSRSVAGADFADPASVLGALNAAFPMDAQNGMYFTIWYGVYDTTAHQLTYAAAGHHPAVLVAPNGAPGLLKGKGLPIGCFEGVRYPAFTVSVPPGARLYVFSDGIFEVEPKFREDMFTFEEFVNLIMDWREHHGGRELMFVLEAVQDLQGKPNFDDDCALIEFEFEGPAPAATAAA